MYWTKDKPKPDNEYAFVSAVWWQGHWEYKLWQFVLVDNFNGSYYALCDNEGEEWGDYDDLTADIFYVIPLPNNDQNDEVSDTTGGAQSDVAGSIVFPTPSSGAIQSDALIRDKVAQYFGYKSFDDMDTSDQSVANKVLELVKGD